MESGLVRPWNSSVPASFRTWLVGVGFVRLGPMRPSDDRIRNADLPSFYDDIELYAGRLSYHAGETAHLHVSCLADRYDIAVERWGAERVLVWSATDRAGDFYPVPDDASAIGCDWPMGVEVPIGDDWPSGFYLVTARAHDVDPGYATAHAGFVVRAPRSHAARRHLLVLATNTWNAYNTWGGTSVYTGGREVSFQRPFARGMLCRSEVDRDDRKSRPNRWGEPPEYDGETYVAWRREHGYIGGVGSAGWFMHERRFVEWAEADGYEFDYATSADLDRELTADASALDGYEHVVGVGHDEYWSRRQRDAIERHVERGGAFTSLSGNTMFWQVRLEPTDVMVGYKYVAHTDDPVVGTDRAHEMSGMWADPLVGRPETAVLGAGSAWGLYARYGRAVRAGSGAFTVYRHDHWLFEGTDLGYGDLLGAHDQVVGYETVGCRLQFDDDQLPVAAGGDGTPSDMEVLAFTPASNVGVGEYPLSISALSDQGDLEFMCERLDGGATEEAIRRRRIGNAVIVTCRPFGASGGEVVTVGSTDWVFGLANDVQVQQVTRNALNR